MLGIVKNPSGEILVTTRRPDTHLGGQAEFPGGRLEGREVAEAGLQRELKEELGIELIRCRPLIQIPYAYPDRNVFLDVFTVTEYSGKVRPVEGQKMDWVSVSALGDVRFPKANHGIVRALQLPGLIAVTPDAGETRGFLHHFEDTVRKPEVELIHLRSHGLDGQDYLQLAGQCLERCDRHRARLVINANTSFLDQVPGAGLHLTSRRLCAHQARPVAEDSLVSASCHTLEELLHASDIGLDYVFLGPVIEKVSDSSSVPLGWKNFAHVAIHSTIPVYAIGGLDTKDMEVAVAHGGQGIAAIRAVWQ